MKKQVHKRPAEEFIEQPVVGRLMTDAEAKKRMAAVIAKDPKRYASLKRIGTMVDKMRKLAEGGAR